MKLFKRFHIPHSKKVTVAAAVAVGLALCLLCMVPRAAMAAVTQRDLPIYCVQKDSKVCSPVSYTHLTLPTICSV